VSLEGALGKIAINSVRKPKQLLELRPKEMNTQTVKINIFFFDEK